ncbi:MAG: hypothetical protein J3Q66DRAFT_367441 [Benniella sp.]|nr:MAG: hypothetical protein J3Q66DRAFT_367441 [Benniella sp.]
MSSPFITIPYPLFYSSFSSVHHPLPSTVSTVQPMNTPACLPHDRTEAPASAVHASVSQTDTHSSPDPASWIVRSAQTFDETLLGPSPVLQQHYQTLFEQPFIHPTLHPSPPPPPTQQQLAHLRLLLAQSHQREEQLQWQLIRVHQQLYLQQQQHSEQFFASQNAPPSQVPLPMNNGSLPATQPWASEVLS